MSGARVLVVDDEPALVRALSITLRAAGWEVHVATTGAQALAAVPEVAPDVVVLDLGLPDVDGTEVLRRLRRWSTVPVVVLSGRGRSDDVVTVLDLGADDHVTKPFATSELVARMRAAVRRATRGSSASPALELGPLSIDLDRKQVRRHGTPVRLSPTEWQVLEVLARHVGRPVPGRDIAAEVWGPAQGHEGHLLRVHVAQLRRKLEDDPARPRHLRSAPGPGYLLRP